jgi:hypothetical protein
VCELAGGIAAYVLRGEVDKIVNENMQKSLNHYNQTAHGGVTETWDVTQHKVTNFLLKYIVKILIFPFCNCEVEMLWSQRL